MMFNLTPREKLTRARVLLTETHPFFARLCLLLNFIEVKGIGTMGVDAQGNCYYEPEFVDNLPEKQIKGVLAHEVMHCALHHMTRGEDFDHQLFNVACDLVVNYMLLENNLELPDKALLPSHNGTYDLKLPDGNTHRIKDIDKRGAESIYHEIKSIWKNQGQQGGQDGNGDGNGVPKGFDEHRYGDASGNEKGKVSGRDKAYWDNKVVESAISSRMAGKEPKGMDRTVEKITKPRMTWRQLLQRYVRNNIPYDFTWRTPNKRTYSTKVYMPRQDKTGIKIIFLIDTSGSMSDDELSQCFSEINGIVKSFQGVELEVIYHDTKVYQGSILRNPTEYDIKKELKQIKGGGGTSFEATYEWLEKNKKQQDIIIHLTDGYDTFPEQFRLPIIICLQKISKSLKDTQDECPYAQVVKIPKYEGE